MDSLTNNFSTNTLIKRIYKSTSEQLTRFPSINYLMRILLRKLRNEFIFRNYFKTVKNQLIILDFNLHYYKTQVPKWAAIEITNACNLNCIMCNTKLSKRSRGYISPEIFESILKQLKKIGLNTIMLHTVGEPFMYKNLDDLFEIIEKYNFKVFLSTNGQFPKKIESLIYKFSHLIKNIRFSIDGAKKKTYEMIRKGGKYENLINSLEIIHKYNRSKINYKIPISIDSILSLSNIYEIPLFFKTFGKYCWPEFINFHIVSGLPLDLNYFWKAFPFPNLIIRNFPCKYPFNAIFFTFDGKATLCCRDFNGELVVGDLNDESLEDIWNGKKSNNIRDQMINKDTLNIESCQKCYSPYPFVSNIINNYIHFLHFYYPNLSPHRFGESLYVLLKNMDHALKNKDKTLLKTLF